jgi:hypothetical protein
LYEQKSRSGHARNGFLFSGSCRTPSPGQLS